MNSTVEAQARRYLRLFPLWMRAGRGEEAVGLVLDQLPPDAGRLPARARADLVRAGLHAQRVGRPPAKVRWSVAYAGPSSTRGEVPEEWRPWLLAGLPRRSFALGLALERNASVFLPLAIFGGAPAGDGSWNLWRAVPALALWVLVSLVATIRGDRWRTTVYLRNGFLPDGRPIPTGRAWDAWTGPALPNARVVPGLVAAAVVLLGAAVTGWPSFGSPGNGIWLFWLVVAASVALWLAMVDHLIRWRLAPQRATLRAVDGAPRSGWSVGAVVVAVLCGALAAAVAVVVGGVTGILGIGTLARWVLAASAAIVAVRGAMAERHQARRLGLWDLVPSTGPQLVGGAVPLPPPPDRPPPTAFG